MKPVTDSSFGRVRAWLLNVDADVELAATGRYQTAKALLVRMHTLRSQLDWLVLGERVLDLTCPPRRQASDERVVLCWCPTPHALSLAARAGWPTPRAPGVDILRRVNHRAFQLACDREDSLRAWVTPDDDLSWLAHPPAEGWRLKRPFGFAGRGQRVVRKILSRDDQRFVADSLRTGFWREPNRAVVGEWSLHGFVGHQGVMLGRPCRQVADRFGQVLRIQPDRLPAEQERALFASSERVATELLRAGYFGPFGVDALEYEASSGPALQLVSDINARFTLGWSIGMAGRREEALARCIAGE